MLTSQIIGGAIEVHKELGPGLLESVYQKAMAHELAERGLSIAKEVPVEITYHGHCISDDGLRMDLLVDDSVVVELKSVAEVKPVHKKQLLTYLRLAAKPMGLLINFNEVLLKDGVTRITTMPMEE